jgi:glutathione S-transferase
VYANSEDLSLAKNKSAVVTTSDPSVERIRRNHLNDIENIVPFVLVGFFYVATDPDRRTALWHFRVFFISRLLHTLTYQVRIDKCYQ